MVTMVISCRAFSFCLTRASGSPAGGILCGACSIFRSRRISSIAKEQAGYSPQYHHLPTQRALNFEGLFSPCGSSGLELGLGSTERRSLQATVIFVQSRLLMGNM